MKQTENDSTATQQQLQIEIAQLKIKQEKLNEDKEQVTNICTTTCSAFLDVIPF